MSPITKTIKEKSPLEKKYSITIQEYARVHYWLKRNYGKAEKCEDENCLKVSKVFNWSLKKGLRYENNRDNFLQLCRSCHSRMDLTEEGRKKLSEEKPKIFSVNCKLCGVLVENVCYNTRYCPPCFKGVAMRGRRVWNLNNREHHNAYHSWYQKRARREQKLAKQLSV